MIAVNHNDLWYMNRRETLVNDECFKLLADQRKGKSETA